MPDNNSFMKNTLLLAGVLSAALIVSQCKSGLVTMSNGCYNLISSGEASNKAGNYTAALDDFNQVLKKCDAYDAKEKAFAGKAAALNGQIHNPTLAYLPYGKLGMPGSWNTDYGDIAPRLSVAWSPSASKGAWGALLGTNKTVIRGGYGIAFDRVAAGNNVLTTLSGGFS